MLDFRTILEINLLVLFVCSILFIYISRDTPDSPSTLTSEVVILFLASGLSLYTGPLVPLQDCNSFDSWVLNQVVDHFPEPCRVLPSLSLVSLFLSSQSIGPELTPRLFLGVTYRVHYFGSSQSLTPGSRPYVTRPTQTTSDDRRET